MLSRVVPTGQQDKQSKGTQTEPPEGVCQTVGAISSTDEQGTKSDGQVIAASGVNVYCKQISSDEIDVNRPLEEQS